jgi:hypothetical protein
VTVGLLSIARWFVPYLGPDRRRGKRMANGESGPTTRTNGIAVVRFQTAVLWSAAVLLVGGLLTFLGSRLVADQDRTNALLWAEIKSQREAFQEYKLAASTSHELMVTRLTVLETQFAGISSQLSEIRLGQLKTQTMIKARD